MEQEQSPPRHRLNKGFSWKFPVGYHGQHTSDKGWKVQQSKGANNKGEDNNPHVNNA